MRRFSSDSSLLDLDFLPWKRVALKDPDYGRNQESGSYTSHSVEDTLARSAAVLTPRTQEARASPGELVREHSVSVENLSLDHPKVCALGEGYRAYSESQLAPADPRDDSPSPAPSRSSSSMSSSMSSSCIPQKWHHRSKLSATKLHLQSLFGQSPHSSNSNLSTTEFKDSATERRSRLLFMHQWSQMGPSKKRKISREELGKWAESLSTLLANQTGVSVFEAFLRSEFSEENLHFYQACEQYRLSSNNFSLQRRARDICRTYIQHGAPREVNLDSKTRDLTVQLLQAPSHTSLSHAQKRIYVLLDTDCYPRFLHSDIYLSLLQESE